MVSIFKSSLIAVSVVSVLVIVAAGVTLGISYANSSRNQNGTTIITDGEHCLNDKFYFPNVSSKTSKSLNRTNQQTRTMNIGFYMGKERLKHRFQEFQGAIRSIMVHRSCPIHFHLIMVDGILDLGIDAASSNSKSTEDSRKDLYQKQIKIEASALKSPQSKGETDELKTKIETFFLEENIIGKEVEDVQLEFTYISKGPILDTLTNNARKLGSVRSSYFKASPDLVFPSTLDEIALLDSDIIVVKDLCPLYEQEIDRLKKDPTAIMSMAPNLDKTYLAEDKLSSPLANDIAMEVPKEFLWLEGQSSSAGIESSIAIFHLNRMRSMNWTETFMNALLDPQQQNRESNLLSMIRKPSGKSYLLHQHIFNWMGRNFNGTVSILSNAWNFQVNYRHKSHEPENHVYPFFDKVAVIHGTGLTFGSDVPCFENFLWWLYQDAKTKGCSIRYSAGTGPTIEGNRRPMTLLSKVLDDMGEINEVAPEINELRLRPATYKHIIKENIDKGFWE